MTDIPIGMALRNGLVRQTVARTRDCDSAEDLLHAVYLKPSVIESANTTGKHIAKALPFLIAGPGNAIGFKAVNANRESVGTLSRELPAGEIRRLRAEG